MKENLRILVIDDEKELLSGLKKIIEAHGHVAVTMSNPNLALEMMRNEKFDMIFCDLQMPETDGMRILREKRAFDPETPLIILTAYGTINRAVMAMKEGAFDFIEKPFDVTQISRALSKAETLKKILPSIKEESKELSNSESFGEIVGRSSAMKEIFSMIMKVAQSDANILITGESGTGKELVARSIHTRSNRREAPFVPVNCGALPENLFEAELFGYEKGAFTGATKRKEGLLEYANEGTFFFDEVCELPVSLQSKLLRAIQERMIRHVGGNEQIDIDVRIISATNRDTKRMLSEENFREDLYYRLNVINIHLPPLRDRKEDISLLAKYFLRKFVLKSPKRIIGFDEDVLSLFENYEWPGNIRELENVIERAVTLSGGSYITPIDLPKELNNREDSSSVSIDKLNLSDAKQKVVYELEKKFLLNLLQKHKGNVSHIAEEAGMTRRNIHRLLNLHGLDPDDWRG